MKLLYDLLGIKSHNFAKNYPNFANKDLFHANFYDILQGKRL